MHENAFKILKGICYFPKDSVFSIWSLSKNLGMYNHTALSIMNDLEKFELIEWTRKSSKTTHICLSEKGKYALNLLEYIYTCMDNIYTK